jgi:hypothetical protein
MTRHDRSGVGQLTDAPVGGSRHDAGVVITIRVEAFDPPSGWVSLAGEPERRFVGWLGLLRVLSDLLSSTPQ